MPVLGGSSPGRTRVARHVERVIERKRRETVVPAWYRIAPLAQALVPGIVHRAVSRARYRKPRVGWLRRYSSASLSCFGVLTVSQRPSWRNACSRPVGGEPGKRRSLMVPALRQALDRLVVEHVDAAADPDGERARPR